MVRNSLQAGCLSVSGSCLVESLSGALRAILGTNRNMKENVGGGSEV